MVDESEIVRPARDQRIAMRNTVNHDHIVILSDIFLVGFDLCIRHPPVSLYFFDEVW
jgi:hypothetical protein